MCSGFKSLLTRHLSEEGGSLPPPPLVYTEARRWPVPLWMVAQHQSWLGSRVRAALSTECWVGTTLWRLTNPRLQSGEHGALISTWDHTGDLPTRAGTSTHGHGVTVSTYGEPHRPKSWCLGPSRGRTPAPSSADSQLPAGPETGGLHPSGRGSQVPEHPAQPYDVLRTNVFTAGCTTRHSPVASQEED